ncbi:phosphoglucosamine mutase [bacterium (Candidatus Blackallbacteria) CG17_big_fil_post_rev_8_21_14_2_50_48_46]|uniref:Phosphoglucosamine mutase n=1 Tax=bacterium (Candidatus Blackallbacteria) CG17_big_fil_post_rev_8_21_14_2_50_48_46 TaxID=2014261 RepID=A0A2M7G6F4_9BACT|nr:MAG: phosphoglucosamine mutase [bacterium (Candidatus Blackallbacteria) CG18_big_fil_WC_8_21_14_2_50_49_26]PIW17483.1 MAG: phosphoglucosamine mutase [bacterium (Candidatus Blackallbacteria) CG17_big_fil_post_rev_8_21_14_2_50_48_46]PIW48337.1 MAG: phosphoglucosamine mutase [bacterium (Candidatus Blackallbacteria) CG13_big_fil_rev_8_21_14_2_50_49_14]
MRKLFGTDGVRGLANRDLTPEMALQLAQAFIQTLPAQETAPRVYIGKDSRLSGDMLEAALIAGFTSLGCQVETLGVVPTPAVAWVVRHSDAAGGVMISASHNPAPDNGLKFFNSKGEKLSDERELAIETLLKNPLSLAAGRPTGAGVGTVSQASPLTLKPYLEALMATLPVSLKGTRVLLDTANGATSFIAPTLFKENLGMQVDVLNHTPDGLNINQDCGSTHLEVLKTALKTGDYDLGIAFDGDGDRCLAVTPEGQEIDGDKILYFCARYLPELQTQTEIVATVMSNLGFEKALEKAGKHLLRTQVGDRYVLEAMREKNLALGGEQSGHVIFLKHQITGDGLLTALQLLSAWKLSQKSWAELLAEVPSYPQLLKNVVVSASAHRTWQENPVLQAAIETCTRQMEGEGRILVRASGTEPKIRVMAEGRELHTVHAVVDELVAVVEKELV